MRIRIQFFTSMQMRDPDTVFHFNADPDPDQLLWKVMGICEHWSIDPLGLHFEPAGLHLWASTALHAIFWASKAFEF